MAVDDLSTNRDYAHFAAIPWCAAHLGIGPATAEEEKKKEGDQGPLVIITPWIRTPKTDGEDSLWARTLQTPATVPFMLQFWRVPPPPSPAGTGNEEEAVVAIDEVRLLLTLASDVNGVAGVCHGGLVATILDEVAGMLVEVNKRQGGAADASASAGAGAGTYMTASLAVSYLRPVPSSSSLLAGCRLRRRDGRKLFSDAWIEDRDGRVLARADCLYVKLKSAL